MKLSYLPLLALAFAGISAENVLAQDTPKGITILSYNHVGLAVKDLKVSAAFYREIIGLSPVTVPDNLISIRRWFQIAPGQELHLLLGRKDPVSNNDKNGAQNEFIFAIAFDGLHTQTYGGTTFLVHAAVGGSMSPSAFGINGGWGGIRTTSAFVNKFGSNNTDVRGNFYTDGQNKEIKTIGDFTDGYAIQKYKNVDKNGKQGSDSTGNFCDTDFPMFRLADAYLMYAELAANGVGSKTTARGYVNALRTRAGAVAIANDSDITSDFVLDERARELYWEGHRRQDLIRANKFTGGAKLWQWKGNALNGASIDAKFNVYPIPQTELNTNSNLTQNTGY